MMQNQKKTNIKVGITVLVSIILVIFVYGWTKNIDLFSEKKILKINFDSVAGLEKGDAVTINGVKKGFVEDIISTNNSVLVKCTMNNDVVLRSDAKFSVMMLDLMGGKKIEISPGNNNGILDFENVQNGIFAGDISTAMAMLSSVQTDLVDVIKEVKISLTNINSFLADETFNENVKSTLAGIENLTEKLNTSIEENRAGIKKLITSGIEFTEASRMLIEENKTDISETLTESKKLLENGNKLIKKINELALQVQNKENNLGKLLYDEEFLIQIKNSMRQLEKLTKILTEQLEGEGINVDANIF
ncbi:MAG: MCE family protein [Melioribacteraceae bacterium]|nr:MCE family protein [Melioribacteraceae bacterium]